MILVRNGKPYFGLEWAVDLFGEADKVYVVFGQSQLNTLYDNMLAILDVDQSDGLSIIEQQNPYEIENLEEIKRAMSDLKSILD
jgi:hypothetical protein